MGSQSRAIRRTVTKQERAKQADVAQRVLLKHKALRGAWYDCLVDVETLLAELDKRQLPTELGEAAEMVRTKLERVREVAAEVEGVGAPDEN